MNDPCFRRAREVAEAYAPEDLYDLMALDARTDRVLPNGWCTLPPAKSCDKGNAGLTCDLFVTDKRFLDVHEGELVALDSVIDRRQRDHEKRTGERMSENQVKLTLRRREQRALTKIVETLMADGGDARAVRGAGVESRQDSDRGSAQSRSEAS